MCCAESVEEADWLDLLRTYMRRKNVTDPWSLCFLYKREEQMIESTKGRQSCLKEAIYV